MPSLFSTAETKPAENYMVNIFILGGDFFIVDKRRIIIYNNPNDFFDKNFKTNKNIKIKES